MDEPSPPVRVTRARAAAKTDNGVKTTKIATAASKAKIARSTSTSKRKTRADDIHEDDQEAYPMDELMEPEAAKTARGRQKKAPVAQPQPEVQEEASAPAKSTRGRSKKNNVEAPVSEPEPAKSKRGRPKKADTVDDILDEIVVAEPIKRPTRSRPAMTAVKAPAPKKTVKFEEPDKENIVPLPPNQKGKPSAGVATGFKANPIRKAAITTVRSTRSRPKTTVKEKTGSADITPLSPKKVTQVGTAKDAGSDDELATMEKTPMKALAKSPLKAPGSIFGTAKKLDMSNSVTASKTASSITQDLSGSIVASPARRPPQSPFKSSFKTSPQRLTLGDSLLRSPLKPSLPAPKSTVPMNAPFKASLLQSPARRPHSPTKVSDGGSPSKVGQTLSLFSPAKRTTFEVSRFSTPKVIPKDLMQAGPQPPLCLLDAIPDLNPEAPDSMEEHGSLKFSGRLSSIMPRHVDPALSTIETIVDRESITQGIPDGDPMVLDDAESTIEVESQSTTPPCSPPRHSTGAYALRESDQNPIQDSDSEDELASASPRFSHASLSNFQMTSHNFGSSPATPTPFVSLSKTPRAAYSNKSQSVHRTNIGFTPLAKQLSDWMAASPEPDKEEYSDGNILTDLCTTTSGPSKSVLDTDIPSHTLPSPTKSSFFEDEMSVREDEICDAPNETPVATVIEEEPYFSPVELDDEDLALAAEADEMSLIDPDAMESVPEHIDDSGTPPSEASQEYGDENAMPIDPALLALPAPQATPQAVPAPVTPKRILTERVFHTVSKVPLKAAAEESPMNGTSKKRSASISRLPVQRLSSNLNRSNIIMSRSPIKIAPRPANLPDNVTRDTLATPSKADAVWSTIGTPARTPRRDLNVSLLKGAVVFVDVHTSEGADASLLFTELLQQMGAKCVKSWSWNGNGEDGSKIGITHIVFKDGGKRTLEKARDTGGVVACVGVGWVLDCERENKWLDEAPYAIDTAQVPRGGHRRRKSMEPRALANLNGALLPSCTTPSRDISPSREFLNLETPGTGKIRRRDSVEWVRSPASFNDNESGEHLTMELHPVPTTPTPAKERASVYGETYLDGVNGDDSPGQETPYFLHREQLIQRTAPPRQRYGELGNEKETGRMSSGFLSEPKDESVMMRLMAARRKSLQWAPKVGSPLARGGGDLDF